MRKLLIGLLIMSISQTLIGQAVSNVNGVKIEKKYWTELNLELLMYQGKQGKFDAIFVKYDSGGIITHMDFVECKGHMGGASSISFGGRNSTSNTVNQQGTEAYKQSIIDWMMTKTDNPINEAVILASSNGAIIRYSLVAQRVDQDISNFIWKIFP